jgi:hypothetical protein
MGRGQGRKRARGIWIRAFAATPEAVRACTFPHASDAMPRLVEPRAVLYKTSQFA